MAPPEQTALFREDADDLTAALVSWCRRFAREPVLSDTIEAGDAWDANCGPMSLAAVLGLPTVEAARPLVQPFRGFMSPTNMVDALEMARQRGLAERWSHRRNAAGDPWPTLGFVRIQWLGPWCDLADPRAAYRYTHWVGVRLSRGAPVGRVPTNSELAALPTADDLALQVWVYDATPNRWVPLWAWERWCPTLWPKRATGWAPVTRLDVVLPTGSKGQA